MQLDILRNNITRHEPCSLGDLLWATRSFQSSDVRDKVFALVALAKNVEPAFVDYGKDLSEVLLRVATHFPSQTALDGSAMSMMEMLSYAQITPQSGQSALVGTRLDEHSDQIQPDDKQISVSHHPK
jgi:hypothetical protein